MANIQNALLTFAQALVAERSVTQDALAMASMRVTFELLHKHAGMPVNTESIRNDLKFLHSRLIELNALDGMEDRSQLAAQGSKSICNALIKKLNGMIETAPEEELIPLIKQLELNATEPAHFTNLEFYKRALGLATTEETRNV